MPTLNNIATVNYKELNIDLTKNSNQTTFNIVGGKMTVTKMQTPTVGVVGTECTFTVTIKNTGANNNATNIILIDDLTSAGYTFVVGSVTVNGSPNAGNVQTGLSLPDLLPNGTHTVIFKATVN